MGSGTSVSQPRCPQCGKFCGESPSYAGSAGHIMTESCLSCGINVPNCSAEDGSCYGCSRNVTYRGPTAPNKRERLWCGDHAPGSAEPLPYADDGDNDV